MSRRPLSLNRNLLAICSVASLGGFLFGFDTAVISGVTRTLTATFHLSPLALGITVSSALWGTVAGAAGAGRFADKYGRRRSLKALGLLYVITAIGCAGAWGWGVLLAFRLLGGLAIGGSSVICPTYIAEVAPAKVRGRLVGAFQANVVIGILLAYVSNYLVGLMSVGLADWRWKFGIAALPALGFYVALFIIPESPRWLVRRGENDEALRVLEWTGNPMPRRELGEIIQSLAGEGTSADRLFQRRYKFPIFLVITIGLFNQLSGINAILYYLNSIFESAGFDRVSSDLQSVLIGFTNLIAVGLAMLLIDRAGRRVLLLIGSVGTTVSLAGVACIYEFHRFEGALVWCLVGFIGFFSFSQGAVIWVYISEVFPNHVRAKGQSLGSFTHWFTNAIVAAVFPIAAARWLAAPFFFFAGVTALQFFVVFFFFPETRGLSLEAMETSLHR
jgi:SP family arabinose:H+ symporter-like MFS transporter